MAGPELLLIKTQKLDVPSLRKLDFVVRDLPASTPVEVIKEDLINEEIPVIDVAQIFTTRPTAKGIISSNPGPFKKRPCPLFKIALDHSVNKEKRTNLAHLIGLKIRITDYVKPKLPVQCFRCQQLGYTKNYCNFQPNCVKCGGPHLSRECKKIPTDPPNCYLCKEKHTANYKGCIMFLKVKEAIKNSVPKPPSELLTSKLLSH
ncbi:hypothetical protein J437_LFUL012479 [Ladona fulva]|uniref:Gag-like protein n=1 Tax=Ladona fulva TaxID=123851 RepID=A0A8K0KDV1_LADFU|nr:hypothetical protein J437_LFUL012479 [Ladona fulva]